ncbi:MAG TPA: tetratricopeptide repeat protein [Pyrinomonadaceae bacterium]|nr:tetratricopeptide repeat protein [Pyrinomonadaceae bacterium]
MSQSLRYSRLALNAPGIESILLAPGARDKAIKIDGKDLIQQSQQQHPVSFISTTSNNEPSVEELCLRAFHYIDQEEFQKAAEAFTELVKMTPVPELYFYLGVSYYELGDMNRAAIALEKAVRLRPENAPAQFVLASVYITPFLKSGDASKLRKAIKPTKKAIQLGHHVPFDHHYLGIVYHGLGNWQAAEEHYQKAIELDPHLEVAYIKLAYLYSQLAKRNSEEQESYYSEAIKTYKGLLQVDPQNSDAYRYMSSVYMNLGQIEAAIEACKKAVEVDSNNLFALAGLGMLHLDAKRYEDAMLVLRRLTEIDPRQVEAYMKKWEQGNQVKSFRADAFTNYAVACIELYRALVEEQRAEAANPELLLNAERSFKKALELEPKHVNALYDLAVLYYRQNRLDEAQERIRELLDVEPNNKNIRDHVQSLLEEQLQEKLLESGLLKEIKEPIRDLSPYRNRTLLPVGDKPLSEIVTEGRR